MDDIVIWIIIAAFYAPLHYLLPVLLLFITGNESAQQRRRMIRTSLIDSSVSMVLAFALVFWLVQSDRLTLAFVILMLTMAVPLLHILLVRCRRNPLVEQ